MTIDPRRDGPIERMLAAGLRGRPAPADACPDAADLAAFVEGELPAAERDLFERHAATCERCQNALALLGSAALPTAARRAPAPWLSAVRLRWVVPATAAAAALLYLIVAPAMVPPASRTRPTLLARNEAAVRPLAQPAASPPAMSSKPGQTADDLIRQTGEPGVPSLAGRVSERAAATRQRGAKASKELALMDEGRGKLGANAAETSKPAAPAEPVPSIAETVVPAPKAEAFRTQIAPAAPGGVAGQAGALTPQQQQAAQQAQVQLAPVQPPVTEERAGTRPAPVSMKAAGGAQAVADAGKRFNAALLVPSVVVARDGPVRWRLDAGGTIARSRDGGATWEVQPFHAPSDLLAGSAPSATVCWLVGRAGTVVVTVDGESWEQRPFGGRVDLIAVDARDARHATVTTRDGRRFVTDDGGLSWRTGS